MDLSQKEKELKNMERVWKVFTHPLYIQNIEKNRKAEEKRQFCRHDIEHFMDVARIAYIFKLERNYKVSKEEIYATALLHDIGKWQQYLEKIPHEVASAKIAQTILEETGFSAEERDNIVKAILAHRKGDGDGDLAKIIYDADKLSRACFSCRKEAECNWSEEKKNKRILW